MGLPKDGVTWENQPNKPKSFEVVVTRKSESIQDQYSFFQTKVSSHLQKFGEKGDG